MCGGVPRSVSLTAQCVCHLLVGLPRSMTDLGIVASMGFSHSALAWLENYFHGMADGPQHG